MNKSNKNSKVGNRRRAFFFRKVESILKNEIAGNSSSANFNDTEHETERETEHESELVAERIKRWALEHRIKKRALNSLLKILTSAGLSGLNVDSRTLLRTPRFIPIHHLAGGKFWHNGIQKCLELMYAKLNADTDVKLNINIDGLPLFKSSKIEFWPILGNVHGKF